LIFEIEMDIMVDFCGNGFNRQNGFSPDSKKMSEFPCYPPVLMVSPGCPDSFLSWIQTTLNFQPEFAGQNLVWF